MLYTGIMKIREICNSPDFSQHHSPIQKINLPPLDKWHSCFLGPFVEI